MMRIEIGAAETINIGAEWREFGVPVRLDIADASQMNLGSIQITIDFDPSRLEFVRERPGNAPDWQSAVNTQQAAAGQLVMAGFASHGLRKSTTLRVFTFRPIAPGSAVIAGTVTVAADEMARRFAVTVRDMTAVIATREEPAA